MILDFSKGMNMMEANWKTMPFDQKAELLCSLSTLAGGIAFVPPSYWSDNWNDIPKNVKSAIKLVLLSRETMNTILPQGN